MGSTAADLSQDELTVLVTGFGPFKEHCPINPSWEIASRLPDYLPPVRAKTVKSSPLLPPVRIYVHPKAIRVSYDTVRNLVPKLWGKIDGHASDDDDEHPSGWKKHKPLPPPKIDIAIHIGMAGPRLDYSIERRGHRDGYAMKDVDGKFLGDQDRHAREGERWIWHGLPKELETDLDLDDVLGRWKGHSPDKSDLRISEDAGRYLCDFIYFSSLAQLWKARQKRKVVFLHVPSDSSENAVASGQELVLQLIRSIVESEMGKGR